MYSVYSVYSAVFCCILLYSVYISCVFYCILLYSESVVYSVCISGVFCMYFQSIPMYFVDSWCSSLSYAIMHLLIHL